MFVSHGPVQRGGAGGVRRRTSGTTAGPACATVPRVRRFRFVMRDSSRRDVGTRYREAVAEYLAEWPGVVIVGESRHGREAIVRVELVRPAPRDLVEEFVRGCPHYVADTFAGLGG